MTFLGNYRLNYGIVGRDEGKAFFSGEAEKRAIFKDAAL